jgi:hypothetical protein
VQVVDSGEALVVPQEEEVDDDVRNIMASLAA